MNNPPFAWSAQGEVYRGNYGGSLVALKRLRNDQSKVSFIVEFLTKS